MYNIKDIPGQEVDKSANMNTLLTWSWSLDSASLLSLWCEGQIIIIIISSSDVCVCVCIL